MLLSGPSEIEFLELLGFLESVQMEGQTGHLGRDCLVNPRTALYLPRDGIGNRHSAAMPATQGYKKLSMGHNQDKA